MTFNENVVLVIIIIIIKRVMKMYTRIYAETENENVVRCARTTKILAID